MNILDTNKHNIKYIGINTYNSTQSIKTIDYFIELIDLGKVVSPYSYCYRFTWNKFIKSPCNSSGIFLGSPSDIDTIVESKINTNNINTFKTVYFDSNCEYPRYKMSAVSSIKRTRLPEKADSIIIPHVEFREYGSVIEPSWSLDNNVILYSEVKNCYYLIDHYPDKFNDDRLTKEFNTLINIYKTRELSRQQEWISILINSGVIPNDVIIFYQGKIVLLDDKEIFFLNNVDSYQNITYLEELDRYISSLQPTPTSEDLANLNSMLKSSDESIVEMGIKLFSSYNIRESLCSLGEILISNFNRLDNYTILNSSNMKYILSVFKVPSKRLRYIQWGDFMNYLYKIAENEDDRKKLRNRVLEKVKKDFDNYINNCQKTYPDFDFSIDAKVK